jgi:hypothetical protein
VSVSNVNIDDDDDVDVDDGWNKNDDYRNLEQFLGATGLTFTPDDPTSISEVVNRFIGNDFLEILVELSNLHHAQNADKYINCSKSLAWKDAIVTNMKKCLAMIIYTGAPLN